MMYFGFKIKSNMFPKYTDYLVFADNEETAENMIDKELKNLSFSRRRRLPLSEA